MKQSLSKKFIERAEDIESWQRENFLNDQIAIHTISPRETFTVNSSQTDAQVQFQMRATALAQAVNQSGSGEVKKPWAYAQNQIQQKIENQYQYQQQQQALKKEANPVPFKVISEEQSSNSIAGITESKPVRTEAKIQASAGGLSYFFRASDNAALYGLGSSFYEDMKRGKRHFSFANLRSDDEQKKTVLGVASFIQHFERLDILVVTPAMDNTFFSQFKGVHLKREKAITASPNFKYTTYHHQGISFLEWDEILQRSANENVSVDSMIQTLVADYDIVLYDLPAVKEGKKKFEILISLLQIMQSVSLVVNLQEDTFSAVSELKRYFQNYKVTVKGLITSRPNQKLEI
jgi:hypothetical protein